MSAIDSEAVPPTVETDGQLVADPAELSVQGAVQKPKTTTPPPTVRQDEMKVEEPLPPHRSHDQTNNLKRSDPFQFGSRYLQENDNVFEFNAWDHVETDDAYKEYAEVQYAKQREAPVSDFDKQRFNTDPAKWWNQFYKNNTANFFKDRKWLQQEFPVLARVTQPDAGPVTLLEVGAGAGNTAFPILASNRNARLKLHACDFSRAAVQVIRENEAYGGGGGGTENGARTGSIQADVWDVASTDAAGALPPGLAAGSVDVVLMIFVFSALAPAQWATAVDNVRRVLRPGGTVLFRDYGRGDLAQVRFKKGRYLAENFYVRGDGTRVYFFERDELARIWAGSTTGRRRESATATATAATDSSQLPGDGDAPAVADSSAADSSAAAAHSAAASDEAVNSYPGFDIVDLGVDRRLLVNRAKQIKMYRCWMQGRFLKPEG